MTVLVMSYSNLSSVKGRTTPLGVTFGWPLVERAGVPGRRMAFIHPFTPEEITWAQNELPPSVEVYDSIPSDWRYEELGTLADGPGKS